MSTPTISYCCIFKDEEKHLPKWIESAKTVAAGDGDEIIACDTGSTDKSCDILREAGIEPVYFEWVNDFSKAKNFVIDTAKGDWIFLLDADEYFSKETVLNARKIIDNMPPDIWFIQNVMEHIDEDDGDRLISTSFHWRIFRNRPDIRYVNPIHEYIKYDGEASTIFCAKNLTIIHTGYSSGIAKRKAERNLKLLQKEIAENNPGEITTKQAHYMADTYFQLGDYLKAAKYADIALKAKDDEIMPVITQMYRYILVREERREGGPRFDAVMDILDEALSRAPDQPDFLREKIRYYYPKGRYYDIEKLCFKYLKSARDPEILARADTSAEADLYFIYDALSRAKYQMGDDKEAKHYVAMALREKPHDKNILNNFVRYFRYAPLSLVKSIMDMVYPNFNGKDLEIFKPYFSSFNYGDVYLYYVSPEKDSFEYYMCSGLYLKAVELLKMELREYFKYAAYVYKVAPKAVEVFKTVVPAEYLTGEGKSPNNADMTVQNLMDKIIETFSKVILACYFMPDVEFEKHKKDIIKYLTSPAKDFLLAGFNYRAGAVATEDIMLFYKYIFPRGDRACLSRLANAIGQMPATDEFLYGVIMDYLRSHNPQGAYNLAQKIKNRDCNYYFVQGVAFLYAKDKVNARKSFIRARALGKNTQDVKDFIKVTDPAEGVNVEIKSKK